MRAHQLRCFRPLLLAVLILNLCTLVFASRAGSLDKGFGTGGVAFAQVPNTGAQGSRDAVVQPDGKSIVVGTQITQGFPNGLVCLARFNLNGTLDTSFGNGGVVVTDVLPKIDFGNAITLQPDGKILVGGVTQREVPGQKGYVTDPMVIRYNPDGTLDTSFGSGGIALPNNTNFDRFINHIALQPDGKIVLGGSTGLPNFLLMRVNSNGSLDTGFGDGGVTFGAPIPAGGNSMEIQADGKIILAGTSPHDPTKSVIARWTSDGTLDTGFDADGVVAVPIGTSVLTTGMSLQSDGKILVTGEGKIHFTDRKELFLLRLNPNGSLDTTFDGDGVATPAIAGSGGDGGLDVHALSDGRILAIGRISLNQFTYFLILRFRSDGSLDTSFDHDGAAAVDTFGGNRLRLQPDGKLVTGGASFVDGTFYPLAVFRFLMRSNTISDFEGDGKSDVSVWRPSNGNWYLHYSLNGSVAINHFGADGDLPTPADFDSDGVTDIAVWRPSNGVWFWINSSNGTLGGNQFGTLGDKTVPGDYDGDGKADIAIYRPSSGAWWIYRSSNGSVTVQSFGIAEDKPTLGDFDGDGRYDLAVFRPSSGTWYRLNSSDGSFIVRNFGLSEDRPVPADFDGDGKTDIGVFRPSTGAWYWINSGPGTISASLFGAAEDRPSPGDYDGDGKADRAVFRPSQGVWYIMRSTAGFGGETFGVSGDIPAPNSFIQ